MIVPWANGWPYGLGWLLVRSRGGDNAPVERVCGSLPKVL